jgi:rhodanese-related sulfurtransferase
VPPHELAERLATGQVALVLDVRSRAEWEAEGHIAGAVCLPLDPELSQVGAGVRAGTWAWAGRGVKA